jgi:hypothetical protein
MASFNSYVMIASPMLSNGSFAFLGTMTGHGKNCVNNVNVIAWNCDDKYGIKPLIEKLLKEAQKQTLADVPLLTDCLNSIRERTFHHDISKGLLFAVLEQVRCSYGPKFVEELKDGSDRFILLSSVDTRTL